MSMSLEIHARADCLQASIAGAFSLAGAKDAFLKIAEAAAFHRMKKVLVDGRSLTGNPETLERFHYSQFAAELVQKFQDRGLSPATRFAYVLVEPVLDPERFGETVALNRGMLIRVFDNLDDAVRWLAATSADAT
jgi:hypothetical protein